jgi:hypothetical protein
MATLKKRGRDLGKIIRRETGVPLPVAMQAGKLLVRDRRYDIIYDGKSIFAGYTRSVVYCECCGPDHHLLVGPRGEYRL